MHVTVVEGDLLEQDVDVIRSYLNGFPPLPSQLKSCFTEGRINTMIVKTPKTVPIGANIQEIPATTKQYV